MDNRAQYQNDSEEAFRLAFDGRQSCLWTALPGIVTEVDLDAMTLSVQPSIQGTVTNEAGAKIAVNLPLLINVPIVFPSAGGFVLTLPIAIDDEVLVIFSSRCIDSWWQSGGIGRPMEARMHDLSDGFAIPGPCSQPKVYSSISSTGAQLRNSAGTSYIEMAADGSVKIVSPVEIDLIGPVNITGPVVVTGDLAVTGGFSATGVSTLGGDIGLTGSLVASGEVTAAGIPLSTHLHGGVTTGGGNTGVPIP